MDLMEINYDELAEKVGGKFRLAVLIKKRLRMLVEDEAPPLVPAKREDGTPMEPIEIVIEEIRQGKIQLEE